MTTETERFWAKVDKTGGCWNWLAAKDRDGYGQFHLTNNPMVKAHRFSYELSAGPISEGLQIDHLCRNPSCVNPEHLETVTPKVNTLRGRAPSALNAVKTHCNRGHEFTPENTYVFNGGRRCRVCALVSAHQYYQRDLERSRRRSRESNQRVKDRKRQAMAAARAGATSIGPPQLKRIQRKRTRGWRMPEGAVYVGRPTKWGNPYRVGAERTPIMAVDLYWHLVDEDHIRVARAELAGFDLACFCPLDQPCHADILLEVANV